MAEGSIRDQTLHYYVLSCLRVSVIVSSHESKKASRLCKPANRHQRPLGLHFVCKDIDRSIRLVRKYGGKVGRLRTLDFRPDELVTAKEARFHDPDGNEFELRQVISIG